MQLFYFIGLPMSCIEGLLIQSSIKQFSLKLIKYLIMQNFLKLAWKVIYMEEKYEL